MTIYITFVSSRSWLVKNGHPKWKAVDLDYPLKGWEQYDCVRKYLGKPLDGSRAARSSSNPVSDRGWRRLLGR